MFDRCFFVQMSNREKDSFTVNVGWPAIQKVIASFWLRTLLVYVKLQKYGFWKFRLSTWQLTRFNIRDRSCIDAGSFIPVDFPRHALFLVSFLWPSDNWYNRWYVGYNSAICIRCRLGHLLLCEIYNPHVVDIVSTSHYVKRRQFSQAHHKIRRKPGSSSTSGWLSVELVFAGLVMLEFSVFQVDSMSLHQLTYTNTKVYIQSCIFVK